MRRLRIVLAACGLLLFACGREAGQGDVTAPGADPAAQAQAFGEGPWLRERLPADTIAYLRQPNPWRWLFGPGGKAQDGMYASGPWVAAVKEIRTAFGKDALIGEAAEPAAGLLYRLASPVEVAVVASGRMASPAANVYATARLDYPEAAALAKAIGSQLGSEFAFDAEGYATLPQTPAPIFLHFDAATRRVSAFGGMYATLDALKALRKELDAASPGPRDSLVLEREIDAGGHGAIWWADVEALRPLLAAGVQDEVGQAILGQIRRVAFGWGSVDGQGRMSVRAELAPSAWTKWLPQSPRKLDLKASGRLRFAMSLALPTAEDLQRVAAAQTGDDDFALAWREAEKFAQERTGLGLAEWIAPFGPDAAIHSDDAGEFLSLRLRDAAAWQRVRETLASRFKASYRTHARGGATLHELRLPGIDELVQAFGGQVQAERSVGEQIYARFGTRLWWLEQEGWLVFAGAPQPLVDRVALGAQEPIEAAFTAAGVDALALAGVAGQSEDVARQSYHFWIGLLDQFADAAGAAPDLVALPTARELGLPERAPLGAALELKPDRVAIELGYRVHPLESLGGNNGMVAAAMAGIVAAIAIPAYQDYTLRAKVAEALSASSSLKLAIAEHYAAKGEMPSDAQALGMELPYAHASGDVDIDGGAVMIRFDESAPTQLQGKYLYLLPKLESDIFGWACGNAQVDAQALMVTLPDAFSATDIENRYLPTQCR